MVLILKRIIPRMGVKSQFGFVIGGLTLGLF
jgi:hypothetical protein